MSKTLSELAIEIERQNEAKKDYASNTRLLSWTVGGRVDLKDVGAFATTEHFENQVADRLEIPNRYFQRMKTEAPSLRPAGGTVPGRDLPNITEEAVMEQGNEGQNNQEPPVAPVTEPPTASEPEGDKPGTDQPQAPPAPENTADDLAGLPPPVADFLRQLKQSSEPPECVKVFNKNLRAFQEEAFKALEELAKKHDLDSGMVSICAETLNPFKKREGDKVVDEDVHTGAVVSFFFGVGPMGDELGKVCAASQGTIIARMSRQNLKLVR
jgi:hypothetical protein